MNNANLIGRLTRDPELTYTPTEKAVTKFSLAIDREYRDAQGQRGVDYIRIMVWGKAAENCSKCLIKGSLVAVEGAIKVSQYQKDGRKITSVEIVARRVQFLDRQKKVEDFTTPQAVAAVAGEDYVYNEDDFSDLPPF